MTKFEEEKEEFIYNLKQDEELVTALVQSQDANSIRIARMIFSPINENELSYAKNTVKLMKMLPELVNKITNDENQTFDLKNNLGVQFLTYVIKKTMNGESIDNETIKQEFYCDKTTGKVDQYKSAVITIDVILMTINIEEVFRGLCKELGLDFSNGEDIRKCSLYFSLALAVLQKVNPTINVPEDITDEVKEGFNEYMIEFEKIYNEKMSQKNKK